MVALAAAAAAGAVGSPPKPPVFGAATPVVRFAADDVGAATEIASGDLNGDGLADVVLTRITYPPAPITHPIGIFLADGHGGFTDGSSLWQGPPAQTEWGRQILIADFNGDHRNDIFVADTGYDALPFPGHPNTLALSTPAGRLVDASANLPAESGYSHSASAADVNGDGSLDLFVGNLCCGDHTPPEILLNDGSGHFTRRLDLLPVFMQDTDGGTHRYVRSLFVDVNGDRSPDLVLGADDHTPDSRVLLNDGTGHFHDASATLPPKPFGPTSVLISLATFDINQDGKTDLIAGFQHQDFSGRTLQILIGNGDGTFRDETAQRLPQQDSGHGWPYAIDTADFNGDGHLDFATVVNDAPFERAPIYLDDGTGTYHPTAFSSANPLFTVTDANGDGRPDIFSVIPGNGGDAEQHAVQLQLRKPGAPTQLHASITRHGIHLAWRTVQGATGYEIWRAAAAKRKRIGLSTRPTYDDSRALHGRVYTYFVRATNQTGASPFSTITVRRS
jgi:hypothetical protein